MAYNERLKSLLKTLAAAVFWLLCWQGLSLLVQKPLLLPSPLETAQRLWALIGKLAFWQSIGMTLLRVTGGFLCGAVCGVLFGALSAQSKLIERLSAPLLAVVLLYQVVGSLIESAMLGSLSLGFQDFRIGIPGMLLQVFGGYLFIKYLLKK